MFKAFAVQPIGFALTFVQDLKLGHYMKVPPRATFIGAFALECSQWPATY